MMCLHPCKFCGKETRNPVYCSRTCSASRNNQLFPKRKIQEKFCPKCKQSIGLEKWNKLCNACRVSFEFDPTIETKGTVCGRGNSVRLGRYPYIRALSRKMFIQSGQALKCKICGYDRHVDVCHIRAIQDFPNNTTVAEINKLTNLVALCKNHHWELDNGFLFLE